MQIITSRFSALTLAAGALLSALNAPLSTVVAQTVFVANNSGSTTTAFTILKFDAFGNGGIWVSNNGYSGSAWEVPAGVALDNGGNLFVAYSGGSSNFIRKFDAAGHGTIFASFATNFVPGIIAFDNHSNLFVVRHGSTNNIEKFSPAGADLGVFGNLAMQWPDALAFDSQGNLFASDLFGQQILKFNTNGQGTVFVTGDYYRGLAFDSSDNLYVGVGWSIDKFATNGASLGTLALRTHEFASEGMMFDLNGNLFFSDYLNGAICKIDALGREFTFATFPDSSDLESLAVQSSSRPELLIAPLAGSKVLLNWPGWAANYLVQSSTNLASNNWIDSTAPPFGGGGRCWVTNAISGKAMFYRLRK